MKTKQKKTLSNSNIARSMDSSKPVDKNPAVIKKMFDNISERYDFLNGVLSLYQDKIWRMITAKKCGLNKKSAVLDVACGTGSLTFELARYTSGKVVGIDFSSKMIQLANKKLKLKQSRRGKYKNVSFKIGDAQNMAFEDDSFDYVTISFGLRNVSNVNKAISEMRRVVKKKGHVAILELSTPKNSLLKKIYFFYFLKLMPLIGGCISGNKSAYNYLPKSVVNFYTADETKEIMKEAGFTNVTVKPLTFGIAFLCIGEKK